MTQGKPHPEAYLTAVELLQQQDPELDLHHCVALEDSAPGVAAAVASGVVTVAIPHIVPAAARSGIGSVAALLFLNTDLFAKDFGWRLAFGCGAVLGLTILFVRRNVPESPRWLFIHGREDEAEEIIDSIERAIEEETGDTLEPVDETITIHQRKTIPFREIASVAFSKYPKRAVLCLALFLGQAFLYNAITFDLGTILSTYFKVASGAVPYFLVIFAAGNFAGPLVLGRLFDTVGRKIMVTLSYLASAVAGCVLAVLLLGNSLTEWTFIALVGVTFFFASAGASAAYLTVSEIFPMETRALAIAFFYAIGTAAGGITGPLLFGHLIDSGSRGELATGFFIGAAVMALGGLAEVLFGVRAEQKALEDIAEPLTATESSANGDSPAGSTHPAARARPAGRYRPGLGSTRAFSPRMSVSSDSDGALELQREVDAIVRALVERGQLDRVALAEAVRARYWGPGRLRGALREAVVRGEVVQVARGRFAATHPATARTVSPAAR